MEDQEAEVKIINEGKLITFLLPEAAVNFKKNTKPGRKIARSFTT